MGLLACLVVGGCSRASEVRYRITVEVDDNGTQRVGSSVWAFSLSKGFPGSYSSNFRGEAVAVDLGSRGTLFVLLASRGKEGDPQFGDMEMLPERLFGDIGRAMRQEPNLYHDRTSDLRDIASRVGESKNLDCADTVSVENRCPFMVRFRDLDRPDSVEAVNPNNLAVSFGPNIRLKRITVEITSEHVTTGIKKRLQWLPKYRSKQFDRQRFNHSRELVNQLNAGFFSSEVGL